MAILPQELQNNEAPMPPEIQDFIVAAATAVTPCADLINKCRTNLNSVKNPKKREKLQYGDVVTFDEIKAAYDGLQGFEKKISRGFSQTFRGDTRIETPVMNLLFMISIAFSFINKMYQYKDKKNEKQSADLSDIRSDMRLFFDVRIDGKSISISANRYEAYLAIYRSPAAVVEGYSRLVELRQADKDETITKDEKKELDKLEKIDSTAEDFIISHDYLLLKDTYSQQDLDYIFKLKAREKIGVKGKISIRSGRDLLRPASIRRSLWTKSSEA